LKAVTEAGDREKGTMKRRGTMCWRWIRAADHPKPATRVVKVGVVKR
jgi:hypothetical protein